MSAPETATKHRFLSGMPSGWVWRPNQFVFLGRVGDYYYRFGRFPSARQWFLNLKDTLTLWLQERGFGIIIFVDQTQGLRFARPEMWEHFRRRLSERIDAESVGEYPADNLEIVLDDLGALLQRATDPADPGGRVAVVVERIENILEYSGHGSALIVDRLQGWSAVDSGNVSILIADVPKADDLPCALVGGHRSGVAVIDVGLPSRAEINEVLVSAEQGDLVADFGLPEPAGTVLPKVDIDDEQRDDIIAQLEGRDVVTVLGYLQDAARRGLDRLTLRDLHSISARTPDIWPRVLTEATLEKLHQALRDGVKGQDAVIEELVGRLRTVVHEVAGRQASGRRERGLLHYMFFAGPTGVGKTETFRVLTSVLEKAAGGANVVACRKFNMPEYKDEHSAFRFYGAPPSYVGHGRGELGEFLISNPISVVLFDEFEKAHRNIWNSFLTMLEGSLTTGDGIQVDLSQAIFVFTSNAGADRLTRAQDDASDAERQQVARENRFHVEQALRGAGAAPELIGRLAQAIVCFNHLPHSVIRRIVEGQLRKVARSFPLHDLQFDPSVQDYVWEDYLHRADLGARAVVEFINQRLRSQLMNALQQHRSDGGVPDEPLQVAIDSRELLRVSARPIDAGDRFRPSKRARSTASRQDLASDYGRRIVGIVASEGSRPVDFATGFFATPRHLVTTLEVVGVERQLAMLAPDLGGRHDLDLLAEDASFGLALLQLRGSCTVPPLPLALGNALRIGRSAAVYAVGHLHPAAPAAGSAGAADDPAGKLRRFDGIIRARLDHHRLFDITGPGTGASLRGCPVFARASEALVGVFIGHSEGEDAGNTVMSGEVRRLLDMVFAPEATGIRAVGLVPPVLRVADGRP